MQCLAHCRYLNELLDKDEKCRGPYHIFFFPVFGRLIGVMFISTEILCLGVKKAKDQESDVLQNCVLKLARLNGENGVRVRGDHSRSYNFVTRALTKLALMPWEITDYSGRQFSIARGCPRVYRKKSSGKSGNSLISNRLAGR